MVGSVRDGHVVVEFVVDGLELGNGMGGAGKEAALDHGEPAVPRRIVGSQLAEEHAIADSGLHQLDEVVVGPVLGLPVAPRARIVVDEELRLVEIHVDGSLGRVRLEVPDGVELGQAPVGLNVLVVEAIGAIALHLQLAHQRPNRVVHDERRLVREIGTYGAHEVNRACVGEHDNGRLAAAQKAAEPLEELPIRMALGAVVAQVEVGRDDGGVLGRERAEHDHLLLVSPRARTREGLEHGGAVATATQRCVICHQKVADKQSEHASTREQTQ